MNLSHLTDQELIDRLRQQMEPRLLNELLTRHQKPIVQGCYRHLKNHDEAQDVAQEVMIRNMTKLPSFRGDGTFTAWRDKIIYNRCADHLKQDKGLLHQEISEKIIDSLADELDADNEEIPTVEELSELMEQISGEAKRILLLKYE